jgi:predicted kinase
MKLFVFAGLPGTGKSAVAEAVGREWDAVNPLSANLQTALTFLRG